MDIENSLKKLNFSEREATVYLALLRLGEAPVGELIKKTGLHRELVYGALRQLERQGLVHPIEKQKIRHYIAEDPKLIAQRAHEQARLATELAAELKTIYRKTPVLVRVFEGSAGYEEVQRDIDASLKDNQEYCVIGASGKDWYDINRAFYERYHRGRFRRGIRIKMVTFPNEAREMIKNEVPGYAEIRVLPQGFAVPASTKVYADKILLQIFSDPPVAIMVQSKEVATAYRHYFQTLWQIAKMVKK